MPLNQVKSLRDGNLHAGFAGCRISILGDPTAILV